jgi:hypothetical protein
MAAVIDKLANSGLGWFNDIFQLRVYFDADLVDPHQVAVATPPSDEDEDDAVYTSEVPLFVAGAAVQGFIRVVAPPGRTVSHNGISIVLRSTLVSADEDISSELREEEMDVVPEGKIAGTVDMPFVFPGVLTSGLANSYEGTLFSVRHVVVVTVARPWYTFEVTRTAGFGIQRLFDIPTRCSYALELSSSGETTETVAAVAEGGSASPPTSPPPSAKAAGSGGAASRTGASKTDSAVGPAGAHGSAPGDDASARQALAGSAAAAPAPAAAVPSPFDSQLALYGPQQAAIVDMDDGSVVDFKFDKGCYEQAEALSGSLTFSGVTQPIVLVRLAVLRVEYCNGETEDEVVFDETILDARRWRARKEHAAALAGIPPAKGSRSEGKHRRAGRRSGRVASSRRGAGAGASSGSEEEEEHGEGEGDEEGEAEEMAAESPAHAGKHGGREDDEEEEEEMLDAADEEGDGSTLRRSASGGSSRGSRRGDDEGDAVEGRSISRRSTAASSLSRGVAASSSSSSRSAAVVPLSRGDGGEEDEATLSAPASPSVRSNAGGASAVPASSLRSPVAADGSGRADSAGGRQGKAASAAGGGAAAEAAQLKEFEEGEPSAATLAKGRAKAKARVAVASRARRDNVDVELEDEAEGAADEGEDEDEGEEESDEHAWFPSPEDMEGPYGDGSEVDPDLPVVGDVSLAVELDFAQIPGVCPTLSLKLASGEDVSTHKPRPTEGSFAVAPRQVPASSKRLSAHDATLQEDVSVRFFLRLTVYTHFHPAAKRWVSREVVIFRERLHGTPILPHLRAQPHFLFSPTASAAGGRAARGTAGVPGGGRPAPLARGQSAGKIQPLESPSGGAAAGAGTGAEGATSPKLQPLAPSAAAHAGSPRLASAAAPAASARSAASRGSGGGGKPSPAVSPLAEGTGPSPRGRVPSAPLADGDLDEMEGGLG